MLSNRKMQAFSVRSANFSRQGRLLEV